MAAVKTWLELINSLVIWMFANYTVIYVSPEQATAQLVKGHYQIVSPFTMICDSLSCFSNLTLANVNTLQFAAFLENIHVPYVVPNTVDKVGIDSPRLVSSPLWNNLILLFGFALQHRLADHSSYQLHSSNRLF